LRRKLLPHAVAELAAAAGAGTEDAAARVEAVLDWLEANGYLSQERFVESRVHARSARFGNLRIRQELKQHQVALGAEAAQALKDSELQRARAVRARKFASWPATAAERARQGRFLAGRGFSPEVIGRALRGGPDAADDPDDGAS
jgi:regulatory protein